MGDKSLNTSDASFLLDIAERMDATLDEVTDALAFLIAQTVSKRRKERWLSESDTPPMSPRRWT